MRLRLEGFGRSGSRAGDASSVTKASLHDEIANMFPRQYRLRLLLYTMRNGLKSEQSEQVATSRHKTRRTAPTLGLVRVGFSIVMFTLYPTYTPALLGFATHLQSCNPAEKQRKEEAIMNTTPGRRLRTALHMSCVQDLRSPVRCWLCAAVCCAAGSRAFRAINLVW